MVNDDPRILKPLDSMVEKLGEMHNLIISMFTVASQLYDELPLNEKKFRKVRSILRGGWTSPTRRNLIQLN